jgi:hypothetical protein
VKRAGSPIVLTITDRADISQRHQHTDTGRGHQPTHRLVLTGFGDQTPAQCGDLLVDGFPSPEQGFNNIVQRTVGDQAFSVKVLPTPLPASRPNGLRRIWLPDRPTRQPAGPAP